ncbi:MAG: GTP 3',8-cyclase MoaA [Nitrospiraceae bacterium]|nr:MAG: GTP 3',8-cyclase MoaA [Nitrospiraceae bacterium]
MNNSNNKQKKVSHLKDKYDRRIDYLRISITDKCNLKCIYCSPEKALKHFNTNEILTDEEIIRFLRVAHGHGLSKVRITGGEPLLRKNITGLITTIRKTGIRDLSLTTNGLMLGSLARKLKDAGLKRVNISLDTLDADRYEGITRGGNIALVWKAIKASESAGLTPVKINVVPIRGLNDDEIESFASLTYDNNFHIRFIEFMPAVGDGMWASDKYVKSDQVLKKISALGKLEPFKFRGNGPSRNFRLKGAKGVIGIISPLSDHFCKHCNRLRLTANGRLRPCLFSKETIDIKTPMRNGISDEQLEELFLQSVNAKPRGHGLQDKHIKSGLIPAMSEIGG